MWLRPLQIWAWIPLLWCNLPFVPPLYQYFIFKRWERISAIWMLFFLLSPPAAFVFPDKKCAPDVLSWLRSNGTRRQCGRHLVPIGLVLIRAKGKMTFPCCLFLGRQQEECRSSCSIPAGRSHPCEFQPATGTTLPLLTQGFGCIYHRAG